MLIVDFKCFHKPLVRFSVLLKLAELLFACFGVNCFLLKLRYELFGLWNVLASPTSPPIASYTDSLSFILGETTRAGDKFSA